MNQKGFILILIVALIAIVALGGGYFVYQRQIKSTPKPTPSPEPVFCTQDAKLCPDGSYVSRVGPKCEFAPCPSPEATSSADTANWKTYTNKNYSVKYPDSIIYKEDHTNNTVRFLFKEDEIKEDKLYTFYNRYLLISNEGEISPSDAAKKQAPKELQKSFIINNSSGVQVGDAFNYYLRLNKNTGSTINLVMFVPDGTVKNIEELNEMKVLFLQILSTFRFD